MLLVSISVKLDDKEVNVIDFSVDGGLLHIDIKKSDHKEVIDKILKDLPPTLSYTDSSSGSIFQKGHPQQITPLDPHYKEALVTFLNNNSKLAKGNPLKFEETKINY